MVKQSLAVASDVQSRAKGIDQYLKRIERLHSIGDLSSRDAERAYTGGFLEFHAFSERAIEKLFIGLLQGSLRSADSTVRSKVRVLSRAVAADIVKGDRPYVDWLPYSRYTVPRAHAFFTGGRPFDRLSSDDISALEESGIIRNALAHQSATALRRFRRYCVDGKALPPSQSRPGGYLRGFHAVGQTRMNYHLAQTISIMRKLSK